MWSLVDARALSRAQHRVGVDVGERRCAHRSSRCREKAKFESDAALWWNEDEGPFAALHAMNPVRVRFIRDALMRRFEKELAQNPPYAALRG